MAVVEVPYKPRNWAKALHASFKRWAVLVLHRRAGKTTAILNHHQRAASDNGWEEARLRTLLPNASAKELGTLMKRRVYWHVMPSYHQAKLTGAWDTLKEISANIPGIKRNESEMLVVYPNGNKIQLIGADKPDSLRGPGLSGLSLDEYSQIPENAYGEVLSKSLADHLGYCIWSGTIQGQDHLFREYQSRKNDPGSFALWQDVDKSLAEEEGPTIEALRQALLSERKDVLEGKMTRDHFEQEWYLSVDAAIKGAFYADELAGLRRNKQITRVPYDPALPVNTDWDLGIDAMAIWFSQSTRSGEVRLIDYHEDIGGGLVECIKVLKSKPYIYGEHWAPHDIEIREISSHTTRREFAANLGVKFRIVPRIEVADGINAAKLLLPRCWFDEEKTKFGLDALRKYRKTWQQKFNQFSATPVHDAASHAADAFRGLAVRYRQPRLEAEKQRRMQSQVVSVWS